jgi:uncharacterized protein YlxW (UPF0749 family)
MEILKMNTAAISSSFRRMTSTIGKYLVVLFKFVIVLALLGFMAVALELQGQNIELQAQTESLSVELEKANKNTSMLATKNKDLELVIESQNIELKREQDRWCLPSFK